MDQKSRLLIDGDVLAYRCLTAAFDTNYVVIGHENEVIKSFPAGFDEHGRNGSQQANDWADKNKELVVGIVKETELPPIAHVGQNIKTSMEGLFEWAGHDNYEIWMSDSKTFRFDIYPEYKANRPPKPPMIEETKDLLWEHWTTASLDYLEADDAISIVKRPNDVIVSVDKDFHQIPGLHFNPATQTLKTVDAYEALYNLYYQLIVGDRVDNIKGVAGYGDKKAKKVLDKYTPDEYEECLMPWIIDEMGPEQALINYKLIKLLETLGEMWEVPEPFKPYFNEVPRCAV